MRKRNLKFWGPLFLIATLVAAAAGCKEKTPGEQQASNESPTIVDDYIPPFKIIQVSDWRDGGSTGFELIDSKNKSIQFCECRIGGALIKANSKWFEFRGRFFFGAMHPTYNGAKLVVTTRDEKALLEILQSALETDWLELISSFKGRDKMMEQRRYELIIARGFLKRRGY